MQREEVEMNKRWLTAACLGLSWLLTLWAPCWGAPAACAQAAAALLPWAKG